jgi:hypothetical protein
MMTEETIILLLGGIAMLILFGIIFLVLIIISTVFLRQRRSTSGRRKYGKVAEILSYILMFPLPLFVLVMLFIDDNGPSGGIAVILIACAIPIVLGGLSAFIAHNVKKMTYRSVH